METCTHSESDNDSDSLQKRQRQRQVKKATQNSHSHNKYKDMTGTHGTRNKTQHRNRKKHVFSSSNYYSYYCALHCIAFTMFSLLQSFLQFIYHIFNVFTRGHGLFFKLLYRNIEIFIHFVEKARKIENINHQRS